MKDKNASFNIDSKKVIKGLETCVIYEDCGSCPYKDTCIDDYPFSPRMLAEACGLLREEQNLVRQSFIKGYSCGISRNGTRRKRWVNFDDVPLYYNFTFRCKACGKIGAVLFDPDETTKPCRCPWCGTVADYANI